MKTGFVVGVMGGPWPAATRDLAARVARLTPPGRTVKLIVDSDPAVPDIDGALARGAPSPAPILVRMARELEAAGADILVLPCGAAHAFQFDIERAVGVSFVSLIEEAADGAARQAIGVRARVGLLATEACLAAGLYQAELARRGLTPVVPEAAQRADLSALLSGSPETDGRRRIAGIVSALVHDGAQMLLGDGLDVLCDPAPLPLIEARDCLAQALVDIALGDRAPPPPFSALDVGPA